MRGRLLACGLVPLGVAMAVSLVIVTARGRGHSVYAAAPVSGGTAARAQLAQAESDDSRAEPGASAREREPLASAQARPVATAPPYDDTVPRRFEELCRALESSLTAFQSSLGSLNQSVGEAKSAFGFTTGLLGVVATLFVAAVLALLTSGIHTYRKVGSRLARLSSQLTGRSVLPRPRGEQYFTRRSRFDGFPSSPGIREAARRALRGHLR
jgi:hypothetical protein